MCVVDKYNGITYITVPTMNEYSEHVANILLRLARDEYGVKSLLPDVTWDVKCSVIHCGDMDILPEKLRVTLTKPNGDYAAFWIVWDLRMMFSRDVIMRKLAEPS